MGILNELFASGSHSNGVFTDVPLSRELRERYAKEDVVARYVQDAQGNEHGGDGKFVSKGEGGDRADEPAVSLVDKPAQEPTQEPEKQPKPIDRLTPIHVRERLKAHEDELASHIRKGEEMDASLAGINDRHRQELKDAKGELERQKAAIDDRHENARNRHNEYKHSRIDKEIQDFKDYTAREHSSVDEEVKSGKISEAEALMLHAKLDERQRANEAHYQEQRAELPPRIPGLQPLDRKGFKKELEDIEAAKGRYKEAKAALKDLPARQKLEAKNLRKQVRLHAELEEPLRDRHEEERAQIEAHVERLKSALDARHDILERQYDNEEINEAGYRESKAVHDKTRAQITELEDILTGTTADERAAAAEAERVARDEHDRKLMAEAVKDKEQARNLEALRSSPDKASILGAVQQSIVALGTKAAAEGRDPGEAAAEFLRSIGWSEKYGKEGERWITLNGDSGEDGDGGTPVKIDGDGRILAGPDGLAAKGIKKLDDFGKKGRGKEDEAEEKPSSEKKPDIHSIASGVEPSFSTGGMASIRDVRKASGMSKADFDKEILRQADEGKIQLAEHDYPSGVSQEDRDAMVMDEQGRYYNGMMLPEGSYSPPGSKPPDKQPDTIDGDGPRVIRKLSGTKNVDAYRTTAPQKIDGKWVVIEKAGVQMNHHGFYEHTLHVRPATADEQKQGRVSEITKQLAAMSGGPDDDRGSEAHNARRAALEDERRSLLGQPIQADNSKNGSSEIAGKVYTAKEQLKIPRGEAPWSPGRNWNAITNAIWQAGLSDEVPGGPSNANAFKLSDEQLGAILAKAEERHGATPPPKLPQPPAPAPAPAPEPPKPPKDETKEPNVPKETGSHGSIFKSETVWSGNTFAHKDWIKSLGGRWDPNNKVWRVPAMSMRERGRLGKIPKGIDIRKYSRDSLPYEELSAHGEEIEGGGIVDGDQ